MKKLLIVCLVSTLIAGCNDSDSNSGGEMFDVGMQRFTLTYDSELVSTHPDFARAIDLYDSPERKLMVKIWYPAEVNTNTQTPVNYGFHTPEVPLVYDAEHLNWPDYFASAIEAYQTHQAPSLTYFNAPPVKKQFPVIIHSHGMGASVESDQRYFEALVQQGYIVVAVGHTYEAPLVTFDNEEHVPSNGGFWSRYHIPAAPMDEARVITLEERMTLADIPFGDPLPDELIDKFRYTTLNEFSFHS